MKTASRARCACIAVVWVIGQGAVAFAETHHDPSLTVAGSAEARAFDIESTSLPRALDMFSRASGISVLCDGSLARARLSAAVKGTMTPQDALLALLTDTGLTATFTSGHSALIRVNSVVSGSVAAIPQPAGGVVPLGTIHVDVSADVPHLTGNSALYASLVQYELRRALSRNSQLTASRYEARVRLWVDPTGAIARSELISTTVQMSPLRQALVRALDTLAIGQPPPEDFPQPVSIRVAVSEH